MEELVREEEGPCFHLIAIESITRDGERLIYEPSEADLELEAHSARLAADVSVGQYLAAQRIPTSYRRDKRPVSHGFRSYGDLFFPRQLIGLDILSRTVDWPNLSVPLSNALLLLLSEVAGNNSRLSHYAADWWKQTPAFSMHAFRPPTRPVEGNFIGAAVGRGSYRAVLKKTLSAYSFIREALPPEHSASVYCSPATALASELDDRPFVIFTDPPYFDFIDYADLSDFYHQIHRAASEPYRDQVSRNVHNESDISLIATSPTGGKDAFALALASSLAAFVELQGFKLGIVHFHHSAAAGWLGLRDALQAAGLKIDHVGFEVSEHVNGYHSDPGNMKVNALFYVSREDEPPRGWNWPSLRSELSRLRNLWQSGQIRTGDISVMAGAWSVWLSLKRGRDFDPVWRKLSDGLQRKLNAVVNDA